MAGTLSACPRSESALGDPAPDTVHPSRPRFDPVRLLQVAASVHVGGLLFASFHTLSLPLLVLLVTGLLVTLVALSVPAITAVTAVRLPAQPEPHVPTDLSPEKKGSGASPSPLPFMGERIAIGPNAAHNAGFARAAARLSRLTSVKGHPWGDLIARVSHELRTPLNAVIGFSDVMQSELLGPVGHPRYREYARHIRDCGRDLLKSAEDTLAITCLLDHDPSAVTATGVDFRAVVEDAWAFHADPMAGHGLTLETDIPDGLDVLVDRRPMRQILINLFAEAVRRSDARGTVGLVATVNGDLAQIEVFLRGRPGDVSMGQASLPMCLARALLELHGAALIEVDDPYSTWRAVTVLRCSAQSDFFQPGEPVYAAPAPQLAMHLC
jgi:signal transduction histidine kinase